VDGTYIEVKGEGKYSYRGVDSEGNTRDSRPGAGRERKAATGFFGKARKAKPNKRPRGMDVERNAAYPPAVETLQEKGSPDGNRRLRRVSYLNNRIEPDRRGIERITRAGLGYKSSRAAARTIQGIEIARAIKKGQVERVGKRRGLEPKNSVGSLSGIAG
jgi:transposase-like protein